MNEKTMQSNQPELEEELFGMMWGHYVSAALRTMADIKVADAMQDRPCTAEELAAATGSHARSLYRLLRALATVGIFEHHGNAFSLTPLGQLLRSDHPRSRRDTVIEMCSYFDAWGQLTETVKTGIPPKLDIYEELLATEESAESLYNAMDAFYHDAPAPMLGVYDFTGVTTVADIGGARGSQIIAVLQHFPDMQGILFDLPDTAKLAAANIKAAGLAHRCRAEGGSFFDAVPGGADLYLIRHVIHNWNDEKSVKILSNIRAVLPDGGRVAVIEPIVPSESKTPANWRTMSLNSRSLTAWWDMCMFLSGDGVERTQEEYAELFARAGLRLNRVLPLTGDACLIEAVKDGEA